MKNTKTQGSTLVIVIIILSLAVIGVLGYVVWSNFLAPKSNDSQKTADNTSLTEGTSSTGSSKVFTSKEVTFEYPASGWKLIPSDEGDGVALLQTDDYKPSRGIGLDSGASLSISLTNQQEVPMSSGVKDVEEITVDGNKGFKYSLEYEGYRLIAFFTVMVNKETGGERNYAISMQTVGQATDSEKAAFDLVLRTMDIK